jgi:hypothetical protein
VEHWFDYFVFERLMWPKVSVILYLSYLELSICCFLPSRSAVSMAWFLFVVLF